MLGESIRYHNYIFNSALKEYVRLTKFKYVILTNIFRKTLCIRKVNATDHFKVVFERYNEKSAVFKFFTRRKNIYNIVTFYFSILTITITYLIFPKEVIYVRCIIITNIFTKTSNSK